MVRGSAEPIGMFQPFINIWEASGELAVVVVVIVNVAGHAMALWSPKKKKTTILFNDDIKQTIQQHAWWWIKKLYINGMKKGETFSRTQKRNSQKEWKGMQEEKGNAESDYLVERFIGRSFLKGLQLYERGVLEWRTQWHGVCLDEMRLRRCCRLWREILAMQSSENSCSMQSFWNFLLNEKMNQICWSKNGTCWLPCVKMEMCALFPTLPMPNILSQLSFFKEFIYFTWLHVKNNFWIIYYLEMD